MPHCYISRFFKLASTDTLGQLSVQHFGPKQHAYSFVIILMAPDLSSRDKFRSAFNVLICSVMRYLENCQEIRFLCCGFHAYLLLQQHIFLTGINLMHSFMLLLLSAAFSSRGRWWGDELHPAAVCKSHWWGERESKHTREVLSFWKCHTGRFYLTWRHNRFTVNICEKESNKHRVHLRDSSSVVTLLWSSWFHPNFLSFSLSLVLVEFLSCCLVHPACRCHDVSHHSV